MLGKKPFESTKYLSIALKSNHKNIRKSIDLIQTFGLVLKKITFAEDDIHAKFKEIAEK